MQNRTYDNGRMKVNPIGALLCLALGVCLAVLSMGYAVGVQATDLDRFRQAADAALVRTGILSAEHAERLAQETVGYLTGRRAGWLDAVTIGGVVTPVPESFQKHMAEVQRWVKLVPYLIPLMIAAFVALVFLTLIGAAAMRTRMFSVRGYLLGMAIPILLAGVGFLWALIDFKSFWGALHQVLIPGGIFAADEAVMQLFPLALFQGYLEPIALTFVYCLAALLLAPVVLTAVDRRVRRRRATRWAAREPMEYR
jgi:hypothetical protein